MESMKFYLIVPAVRNQNLYCQEEKKSSDGLYQIEIHHIDNGNYEDGYQRLQLKIKLPGNHKKFLESFPYKYFREIFQKHPDLSEVAKILSLTHLKELFLLEDEEEVFLKEDNGKKRICAFNNT